ncbi:PilN domain-containing protein, partial [Parvibaculum sp.]|uniref:PilN domain-containing protein n=1 Tax=Parvibaculum sp. TaxID=2024848 RepID=UPI002B76AA81
LKRDVSDARARMAFLGEAKKSPLLVGILAEVTNILLDGTWLFEFQLNGKEVRIRGYSPEASKLIALFDAAPQFTNAQFRSPLVQGQSKELERFDLSFDIREKGL